MTSRSSLIAAALGATLASLCLAAGCGGGSSGSSSSNTSGTGNTGTATASTGATQFALTDAPSQDLSVLQIELLTIAVVDSGGTSTQVFPGTGGSSITVNLLQLHGVSQLLSAFQLAPGTYTSAVLTYQNATAVDKNGNALTVTPTAGSATSTFAPPLVVARTGQLVQLDFNVDASVSNLVTGAGGSLTLTPTVVAGVVHSGQCSLHDLDGTITAITSNVSVTVSLPQGSVVVLVGSTTVVAAGGTQVQGSTSPLAIGMRVDVEGAFDPTQNAIVATEIEEDSFGGHGHGGGFGGPGGADLEGLVSNVGASSIDVLVLGSATAGSATTGVAPGSTTTITIGASTQLAWDGFQGATAPTLAQIAVGQDVAVMGVPAATFVLLRRTRLEGTIASVDPASATATLTVTTDERVAVASLAGFTNPVTLGFSGGLPSSVTVGATIDVAGQFNVTTQGVFTVSNPQANFQNGAGPNGWHGHHGGPGQGGGFGPGGPFGGPQGGQGNQGGGFSLGPSSSQDSIDGGTFTLVSSSPFSITITGDAGPIGNPVTLTVVLSATAQLVERQGQGHGVTPVAAADVAAGITAGRYDQIAAIGSYDATTQTLTADVLIADVK